MANRVEAGRSLARRASRRQSRCREKRSIVQSSSTRDCFVHALIAGQTGRRVGTVWPYVRTSAQRRVTPPNFFPDDNLQPQTYPSPMNEKKPHVVLTLETKEPIELGAFVGAFTSLGNEYDRFIRQDSPDLAGHVDMFVSKVRSGSIIVDLIPWLSFTAPFIDDAEKSFTIEKFVRVWQRRFRAFLEADGKAPETPSELKDWADAVKAVATDSDGSSKVEAVAFEDGKKRIRAVAKFNSSEARQVLKLVETRQRQLEKTEHADHARVLMRFTRSDVGDVIIGRPSGERVKIDEISDRSLALVYGSELAEERIKHEIREADENVFKKGFVVDVNVKSVGGRSVAYAVTNVHQIIDLPD
jgi:hypothetical protein